MTVSLSIEKEDENFVFIFEFEEKLDNLDLNSLNITSLLNIYIQQVPYN